MILTFSTDNLGLTFICFIIPLVWLYLSLPSLVISNPKQYLLTVERGVLNCLEILRRESPVLLSSLIELIFGFMVKKLGLKRKGLKVDSLPGFPRNAVHAGTEMSLTLT